jgi:predicted nicotinamide N-methyase
MKSDEIFRPAPSARSDTADELTNLSTRSSSNLSITQSERDTEGCYDDVGFMFESAQPSTLKRLVWGPPTGNDGCKREESTNDYNLATASTGGVPRVRVALHVVDDEPGALQSGHYIWPAAPALSEFLIQMMLEKREGALSMPRNVLELGAGCALLSLTVLQIMQESLQCVVVTDHDPGTLARATDNYETTLEDLFESTSTEEEQLDCINGLASIPIMFECYEWGDLERAQQLATVAGDHSSPLGVMDHAAQQSQERVSAQTIASQLDVPTGNPKHDAERNIFDLLLGSDLLYCKEVVKPLLESVSYLMTMGGSFLLAQSFTYDEETEQLIDETCGHLNLQRITLKESVLVEARGINRGLRIQQYTWNVPCLDCKCSASEVSS